MASEFRHVRFGLVPASVDKSTIDGSNQIFKTFLDTFNKFELGSEAGSHLEIFNTAKAYFGKSFRDWLIVNYRDGNGARKELVRKIVGYINGKLSGRTVAGQVNIDLNRISFLYPGETIKGAIIYDEHESYRNRYIVNELDFSHVENKHLYEVFALLGPVLVAKFCLSLDGIYYG